MTELLRICMVYIKYNETESRIVVVRIPTSGNVREKKNFILSNIYEHFTAQRPFRRQSLLKFLSFKLLYTYVGIYYVIYYNIHEYHSLSSHFECETVLKMSSFNNRITLVTAYLTIVRYGWLFEKFTKQYRLLFYLYIYIYLNNSNHYGIISC